MEGSYMVDNHIDVLCDKCVGCRNCELVCKCGAITIQANKEGFLAPVIDEEKCVHCGKCTEVCCMETDNIKTCRDQQIAYIAISKNKKLYKKSASGGIFSTIAYRFLSDNENAVVCGAAFFDGEVRHIIITDVEEISFLQGSKYVQSNLNHVFKEIKQYLKSGKKVLFSGTPCQVSALYLYLKQRYDKLYTIDLICHGVPSPQFLKKDVESYATYEKVVDIQFRKKNPLFYSKSGYFFTINSKEVPKKKREGRIFVASSRDPYFSMFMNGLTFRRSCYQCQFANLDRVGDITVGDCDSARYYPDFHPDEATSTVLINSSKGETLWKENAGEIDFQSLDIEREAENNHQLSHPFPIFSKRDDIYDEIDNSSIDILRNRYAKRRDLKERIVIAVFFMLPQRFIRKWVRRK